MNVFWNVRCAKCSLTHKGSIKATTIAGAIRKATIECDGIVQTKDGAKGNQCYIGPLLDGMVMMNELEEAA